MKILAAVVLFVGVTGRLAPKKDPSPTPALVGRGFEWNRLHIEQKNTEAAGGNLGG
ncbi:hypothetical protein [Rhizobium chutanense]|uniref:hypothetical protein n=1 Tax=Rhizobium chutanense TaxID=2035448 RepID=UPI0015CF5858|nr:hypothetical protein [Rhizobium chutanense]